MPGLVWSIAFLVSLLLGPLPAASEGIYCGGKNCYDVLGLKESVTESQIVSAYRKLAIQWHPDKNMHQKDLAQKNFQEIAHAYSILKDPSSRRDYDYALRHPEQAAYNQARYYYRQYYTRHVKVNPFLVLLIALAAWSAFDYSCRWMSYKQAISVFKQTTEYKLNLKRLKEQTMIEMEQSGQLKKKMHGKRTRKEIDAIQVDESVLEEQIRVHGSYRKPKITELAIVQFWLLPYHCYCAIDFHIKWVWKYYVKKQEYSEEDKEYIVRGVINMSVSTWEALDAKTKDNLMKRELWKPENELKYREHQRRATLAANSGEPPPAPGD